MTERQIIFSGPMVRALLAGTKTQTRRVVTPLTRNRSVYGAPGSRLWVRETFSWGYDAGEGEVTVLPPSNPATAAALRVPIYRASAPENAAVRWTPAIHMPRKACRLVLELTAVRVERLLAISVDDCFAEGIEAMRCPQCHLACYGLPGWGHDDVQKTPPEAYWHLWDQINEARGYGRAKNPWCWVLTFRRAAAE